MHFAYYFKFRKTLKAMCQLDSQLFPITSHCPQSQENVDHTGISSFQQTLLQATAAQNLQVLEEVTEVGLMSPANQTESRLIQNIHWTYVLTM